MARANAINGLDPYGLKLEGIYNEMDDRIYIYGDDAPLGWYNYKTGEVRVFDSCGGFSSDTTWIYVHWRKTYGSIEWKGERNPFNPDLTPEEDERVGRMAMSRGIVGWGLQWCPWVVRAYDLPPEALQVREVKQGWAYGYAAKVLVGILSAGYGLANIGLSGLSLSVSSSPAAVSALGVVLQGNASAVAVGGVQTLFGLVVMMSSAGDQPPEPPTPFGGDRDRDLARLRDLREREESILREIDQWKLKPTTPQNEGYLKYLEAEKARVVAEAKDLIAKLFP